MDIPKQIADEMASIEAEIVSIEADAAKRILALRDRLDIYSFVVSAFAETQEPAPFKAPTVRRNPPRKKTGARPFSYDAVIAALRSAADEGMPSSALPLDHMSRLSVLKARGIAQKLPSGNWAIRNS